ncbi:diguanylate cyclase [Microbacterium sp. NPDC055903]
MTAGIALLFSVLGAFELFENDITPFEAGLSLGILVAGLGVGAAVMVRGIELPRWLGAALVIAHALISIYYLGFSDERQNAIAALQELPVMAMYFAWFYGPRMARIGEGIIMTAVAIAAIAGPFTTIDGLLGPANLLGAALFTWLCLEAGLFVRRRMLRESHSDELTGALNRRGFVGRAQVELRRAERHARPVSVAVIDIDKFKAINDTSGHAAGDDVLRVLVSQWELLSRETDFVGRLGGDEFALLLPETDETDAASLMRRLREFAPHPWSWGVVEARRGESIEQAISRADEAMYDDKHR